MSAPRSRARWTDLWTIRVLSGWDVENALGFDWELRTKNRAAYAVPRLLSATTVPADTAIKPTITSATDSQSSV